jgi:hypothetical protein
MAGDWLKMTHALPEKPEVLEIAGRTSLSRFEVVGRLFTLWRWFDTNTVDGNARGVTKVTLNECLFGYSDVSNFVSAVIEAGWLAESEAGISVVKFDEHISESAKTRAQTAKRVAKSKAKTGNAEGNGESVTKTVPKEEKRRGEKNTPKAPKGASTRFEEFWLAWPKNERKQDKAKCCEIWSTRGFDGIADTILADVKAKRGSRKWQEDGGHYIEAPERYLRNQRWEDGSGGSELFAAGVAGSPAWAGAK